MESQSLGNRLQADMRLAGMKAWLENQLEAKQDDKDALQSSMNILEVQAQAEPISAPAIDPKQTAVTQRLEDLEKEL